MFHQYQSQNEHKNENFNIIHNNGARKKKQFLSIIHKLHTQIIEFDIQNYKTEEAAVLDYVVMCVVVMNFARNRERKENYIL